MGSGFIARVWTRVLGRVSHRIPGGQKFQVYISGLELQLFCLLCAGQDFLSRVVKEYRPRMASYMAKQGYWCNATEEYEHCTTTYAMCLTAAEELTTICMAILFLGVCTTQKRTFRDARMSTRL